MTRSRMAVEAILAAAGLNAAKPLPISHDVVDRILASVAAPNLVGAAVFVEPTAAPLGAVYEQIRALAAAGDVFAALRRAREGERRARQMTIADTSAEWLFDLWCLLRAEVEALELRTSAWMARAEPQNDTCSG